MKKIIPGTLALLFIITSGSAFASNECEQIKQKAFVGFTAFVFNDSYSHYLLTEYNGTKPADQAYVPVAAEYSDSVLDKSAYDVVTKVPVQLGNGRSHLKSDGTLQAETTSGWYLTFKCHNP